MSSSAAENSPQKELERMEVDRGTGEMAVTERYEEERKTQIRKQDRNVPFYTQE